MLRLQGPIVYSLQRAFLIDWYFVDRTLITNRIYYPPFTLQHKSLTSHLSPLTSNNCLAQVVTSSPATLYPEIMQGFVRAITSARRYIYLETPYFLPNEPVLFALKTATMAGVDVRIICPHHSDAKFTEWASRSYLRELHEAGAQIFLYEPGFMHSKLMVIDDSLVTCGSTNADFRSFENNFEANVFIYSQGTALRLKKVFLDDQSLSVPLESVTSWMQPKFLPRLWESLTRMISPLL
jgi:cardiolipin synthase